MTNYGGVILPRIKPRKNSHSSIKIGNIYRMKDELFKIIHIHSDGFDIECVETRNSMFRVGERFHNDPGPYTWTLIKSVDTDCEYCNKTRLVI